MRRAFATVIVLGACGGPARPVTPENRTDMPPRPAPDAIFLGTGQGFVAAVCRDADGAMNADACDDRVKAMIAARSEVAGSDGVEYRVTGEMSDGCEASGEQTILAAARADGAELERTADIAVTPPDADVRFTKYGGLHSGAAAPSVPADLREKVAALATANVVQREPGESVSASDLIVTQSIDVDLDGDGARDRILAVEVPLPDDAPTYRWAGLVLVPGGRVEAATTLWESELEHAAVDATLDIDGDGKLEVVFSAEYYEGAGVVLARIAGGTFDMLASYGCGA